MRAGVASIEYDVASSAASKPGTQRCQHAQGSKFLSKVRQLQSGGEGSQCQ
jgi:hypothetical protein